MTLILLGMEITLVFGVLGATHIITSFEIGNLDTQDWSEEIVQMRSGRPEQPLSLVKRDENFNLIPYVAHSWSTVTDTSWEFQLRRRVDIVDGPILTSEDIIQSIKEKIRQQSSQQQYLSSIDEFITLSPLRFQIVTKYPDPLLPVKLSKVSLTSSKSELSDSINALDYIPLETYSDHVRAKINPWYFEYPFLKNNSLYRTTRYSLNPESYRQMITSQKLDRIDEPDTSLWSEAQRSGYQLVNKPSTESYMLLSDRFSFFLANSEVVKLLQSILSNPELLDAFPQESILAQQFSPAGVLGYNPDIVTTDQTDDVLREKLKMILDELEADSMTLTLRFENQDAELARTVEKRLQFFGINIIPENISQSSEKGLFDKGADLTLLHLDHTLADMGPFYDSLIDSRSPFNQHYKNDEVDDLIQSARTEVNPYQRLLKLQKIMKIIVQDDPAGIPLINIKKFVAQKIKTDLSWWDQLCQWIVLSEYQNQDPLTLFDHQEGSHSMNETGTQSTLNSKS